MSPGYVKRASADGAWSLHSVSGALPGDGSDRGRMALAMDRLIARAGLADAARAEEDHVPLAPNKAELVRQVRYPRYGCLSMTGRMMRATIKRVEDGIVARKV